MVVKNMVKEECSMKPGDIVIGTEDSPYAITSTGILCKIINVISDTEIEVELVNPREKHKGITFIVDPKYFKLYEKE